MMPMSLQLGRMYSDAQERVPVEAGDPLAPNRVDAELAESETENTMVCRKQKSGLQNDSEAEQPRST